MAMNWSCVSVVGKPLAGGGQCFPCTVYAAYGEGVPEASIWDYK